MLNGLKNKTISVRFSCMCLWRISQCHVNVVFELNYFLEVKLVSHYQVGFKLSVDKTNITTKVCQNFIKDCLSILSHLIFWKIGNFTWQITN